MASWNKDLIIFPLLDSTTGEIDSTSYTIQLQPIDQAYPTGAVACSQLSSGKWKPDSNLDTTNSYEVYKNASKIGRIYGIDTITMPSA